MTTADLIQARHDMKAIVHGLCVRNVKQGNLNNPYPLFSEEREEYRKKLVELSR